MMPQIRPVLAIGFSTYCFGGAICTRLAYAGSTSTDCVRGCPACCDIGIDWTTGACNIGTELPAVTGGAGWIGCEYAG
ncbi:MAG: hypothetical protein II424_06980 [Bacteroidales bacterium]|nr:hypothetical protein [Bacteroidales bacterium]